MLKLYERWFNSLSDVRKETDPFLLFRLYNYLDDYSKKNYHMPLVIEAKSHKWGIQVINVSFVSECRIAQDVDTAFKFITNELKDISDFQAVELVHQSPLWREALSKGKVITLSTKLSLNDFNP